MLRIVSIALLLLLAAPHRLWAEPVANAEQEGGAWTSWSATLIGQYKRIPPPENDDSVGGFFDQYEFTPNKSSSVPFELGLRDAAFDLFSATDTPIFQARFESPTSNLGVSGGQIDQPFFNQRLDALTRLDGLDIDLRYHRLRTEQLRIFPNTEGPGLVFNDLSSPDDRFYRDRTGVWGEARVRPYAAFEAPSSPGSWLEPQLSLRGGYEWRDGLAQRRFHRGPSNDWLGLAQDLDRSLSEVGGGLLLAPNGLLTLTVDFDYEQLRFESPIITDGDLGYPPPESTRTVAFMPETDRSTAILRLNSRLGDRAVIEGGFQFSQLEQVAEFTPDQIAAGLTDNRVRSYAANLALDLHLVGGLSFNAFFKFDQRDNQIQRDTALFNSANGTQVDPFVDDWRRFFTGGELELDLRGSNRVALGVRYEDVQRDLEYALFGSPRILPENAQLERNTQIISVYGRAAARPWRRLQVDAELGYRVAPESGYIVDLDDNLYGELRVSYLFARHSSLLLSAFLRGDTGKNEDFSMVAGQGPVPLGPLLERSYERSQVVAGFSASASPLERLNLYASLFYSRDERDSSLDLSTLQRYWQDTVPIDFTREGLNAFDNEQLSLVFGTRLRFSDRVDGGLSYAFTRAKALYAGSDSSAALETIADDHVIDSTTHVLDSELGYWVRDGLRVLAGYRYQHYYDSAPLVVSVASAVAPYDRSTHQHTVTLGVTLTDALLREPR